MRVWLAGLLLCLLGASSLAEDAPDNAPNFEGDGGGGDVQTGDLSQQNSNNNNVNKTYNGAGSGSQMPASSAISPSLMSSGQQSCLRSITGGVQAIGFGISSGKYMQDEECNRRLNSITLANLGMKVAAVSLMCSDAAVWRALYLSATPCPILKGGRLLVGRNALLEIKSNPALWIPDYEEDQGFYDQLLAGGNEDVTENTGESISDRFRSTKRQ